LRQTSVALVFQLRAIDRRRIQERIGAVNVEVLGDFQKRDSQALPPPSGGRQGGGRWRGPWTRARSACLGFPPPTSPRWGAARSRALAPRTPNGMFFCRNHLKRDV
jgi:hypothetical protein